MPLGRRVLNNREGVVGNYVSIALSHAVSLPPFSEEARANFASGRFDPGVVFADFPADPAHNLSRFTSRAIRQNAVAVSVNEPGVRAQGFASRGPIPEDLDVASVPPVPVPPVLSQSELDKLPPTGLLQIRPKVIAGTPENLNALDPGEVQANGEVRSRQYATVRNQDRTLVHSTLHAAQALDSQPTAGAAAEAQVTELRPAVMTFMDAVLQRQPEINGVFHEEPIVNIDDPVARTSALTQIVKDLREEHIDQYGPGTDQERVYDTQVAVLESRLESIQAQIQEIEAMREAATQEPGGDNGGAQGEN